MSSMPPNLPLYPSRLFFCDGRCSSDQMQSIRDAVVSGEDVVVQKSFFGSVGKRVMASSKPHHRWLLTALPLQGLHHWWFQHPKVVCYQRRIRGRGSTKLVCWRSWWFILHQRYFLSSCIDLETATISTATLEEHLDDNLHDRGWRLLLFYRTRVFGGNGMESIGQWMKWWKAHQFFFTKFQHNTTHIPVNCCSCSSLSFLVLGSTASGGGRWSIEFTSQCWDLHLPGSFSTQHLIIIRHNIQSRKCNLGYLHEIEAEYGKVIRATTKRRILCLL